MACGRRLTNYESTTGRFPSAELDKLTNPTNTQFAADVSPNDSDPNGDLLFYSVSSGPANGTVSLEPNGEFEYVPDDGFLGIDQFVYEVTDGNGGVDTATVSVEVAAQAQRQPTTDITPLRRGVEGQASATGIGFLMYTQERARTRFGNSIRSQNANHFVAVKFENGQWLLDNGEFVCVLHTGRVRCPCRRSRLQYRHRQLA